MSLENQNQSYGHAGTLSSGVARLQLPKNKQKVSFSNNNSSRRRNSKKDGESGYSSRQNTLRKEVLNEKLPEHEKRDRGYHAKESFSFYRYMAKQNQIGKDFANDREREWSEKYAEIGTMNNILKMKVVMMSDKIKSLKTEGFNYKDRKISKAGRIWVKEGDKNQNLDYEMEERKLFLRSQIRNGILCKDTEMLKQAINTAHKYPQILDQIQLDVTHAELVVIKIQERKRQIEKLREKQRNLELIEEVVNGRQSLQSSQINSPIGSPVNLDYFSSSESDRYDTFQRLQQQFNSGISEADTLEKLAIVLKKYTKPVELPFKTREVEDLSYLKE
ncbi:UNKNOWN [Stylonychia lemnae]|uniref:Uncharacterized protein n=1 Tax=Stylonychia lemnae TaxID=5949 RepID=A0A078AZB9_STYLE|nr:UNKNOWN [Stylonychia lemnae]|eukprot:CDW86552.1 UNKNOWN [Stylonychia lemnae]